MKVSSANSIIGAISLPGDKSISHRAAMFASIAEGETTITNFGSSVDCASTLACFEQLGVGIERAGSTVRVKGVGKYGLKRSAEPLDCGNSGTTVRLISGILAGQDFETTLTGDASLSKRPMKRVIEPLTQMGASFDSADNRLPLTIRGKRPLKAIDYKMPVASAQVKSCVLLAGLYAAGTTSVAERDFIDSANCVDSGIKSEIPNRKSQIALTRDHTERMLRWFGADVVCGPDGRVSISGDAKLSARDFSGAVGRVVSGFLPSRSELSSWVRASDRKCRSESDANGRDRCPAALWREYRAVRRIGAFGRTRRKSPGLRRESFEGRHALEPDRRGHHRQHHR
ncbi:MAG: hypothetical protein IPJ30_22880 [Acidobacteria bacterium]|nr:hypothetical protein [Acidobacteriota bacterium]